MAAQTIDYAALAKQAGAIQSTPPPGKVDYAELARQAGAIQSTPAAENQLGPYKPEYTEQAATIGPNSSMMERAFGVHPVSDTLGTVGTHLKNLVAAPYHAFTDGPQNAEEAQIKGTNAESGPMNVLGQFGLGAARMFVQPTRIAARQAIESAKAGNYTDAANHALDAIPVAGPIAAGIQNDANQHGAIPALLGAATDFAAPAVAGKALSMVPKLPDQFIRAPLTRIADDTIPGTMITPRNRYQAAQRLGVNLDAADATGSPILAGVKKVNEHSLASAPVYDANRAANLRTVSNATDNLLNTMSPLDRESGGALLKQRLTSDMLSFQDRATTGYQNLDSMVGNQPADTSEINNTARAIQDETKAHYAAFPSLKPGKVASIVDDAANYGLPKIPAPRMSGLVNESGTPIASSVQPVAPAPPVFSGLQKLRSNLIDYTRNNPEIVKDSTGAQLQRLTAATDDAMTSAGTGLSPQAEQVFRQANQDWAEMKGRYDSNTSPYYRAVRDAPVSTLPVTMGSRTPEFVRDVSTRVGPQGLGVLQRGAAETALGTAPGGDYNFQSFPRKLRNLPEDYARELFGQHAPALNDIADTAHAMNRDFNPSGTAKLGQKIGELGAAGSSIPLAATGHPIPLLADLAYHGAQYGAAKLMNSPAMVDWLMKTRPPSTPLPISMGRTLPASIPAMQLGSGTPQGGLSLPVVIPPPKRRSIQ